MISRLSDFFTDLDKCDAWHSGEFDKYDMIIGLIDYWNYSAKINFYFQGDGYLNISLKALGMNSNSEYYKIGKTFNPTKILY